jgi:hypothetical protein
MSPVREGVFSKGHSGGPPLHSALLKKSCRYSEQFILPLTRSETWMQLENRIAFISDSLGWDPTMRKRPNVIAFRDTIAFTERTSLHWD